MASIWRYRVVPLVFVFLAGCATSGGNEPAVPASEPYPAKYREIVRDYLRTSLLDPYSVRDSQIAAPKTGLVYIEGTLRHESGWVVCWRGNAKNRMGAYGGIRPMAILIKGDRVVTANSDAEHYDVRTQCTGPYEPFPELEDRGKPRS